MGALLLDTHVWPWYAEGCISRPLVASERLALSTQLRAAVGPAQRGMAPAKPPPADPAQPPVGLGPGLDT